MNSAMSPERNPEFFDRWATDYDFFVGSAAEGFPFDGYDKILDRIVELSDPQPGMKVLDMGIGTGNLAQRFVDSGAEIWGMDFSPLMLEEARKKVPEAHLLEVDIVSDWPLELEVGFDRIVSAYVFHHFQLEKKLELIRKIQQELLREGGMLVIGDTSYPTSADRTDARRALGAYWDDTEFYWAADEVKLMLRGEGVYIVYEQVSSCGGIYLIVPR